MLYHQHVVIYFTLLSFSSQTPFIRALAHVSTICVFLSSFQVLTDFFLVFWIVGFLFSHFLSFFLPFPARLSRIGISACDLSDTFAGKPASLTCQDSR